MGSISYTVTRNKTHQLIGDVKDFGIRVVNKRIWDITKVTNCTNGTFFWFDKEGKSYATSILINNGEILQSTANHYFDYGCPQSVIIIRKDDTVEMGLYKNVWEIKDLSTVKHAVGGVGLINTKDSNFKYDPYNEGFRGRFADVLRKANKTVMAYRFSDNKICLLTRPSIFHKGRWFWEYDLLKLVRDCGYDFAISLDGGGSSFMDAFWRYVFQGQNSRIIHNIMGFFGI